MTNLKMPQVTMISRVSDSAILRWFVSGRAAKERGCQACKTPNQRVAASANPYLSASSHFVPQSE